MSSQNFAKKWRSTSSVWDISKEKEIKGSKCSFYAYACECESFYACSYVTRGNRGSEINPNQILHTDPSWVSNGCRLSLAGNYRLGYRLYCFFHYLCVISLEFLLESFRILNMAVMSILHGTQFINFTDFSAVAQDCVRTC